VVTVVPFTSAMAALSGSKKRHLLLGNGFSIALKPDIFTYGSLYENADFSAAPHVKKLFEALGTQDFEIIIKHLKDAAKVVEVYRPSAVTLAKSLRRDAAAIKDALVTAIAKRHPDRPFDIMSSQYAACRKFVSTFDHIFTLNYDVLLYWALMQDKVDKLVFQHDDGFGIQRTIPTSRGCLGNKVTRRRSPICMVLYTCSTLARRSPNTLGRKLISLSLNRFGRRWPKRNTRYSLLRARAERSGSASSITAICTRPCAVSKRAVARQQTPLWFSATH